MNKSRILGVGIGKAGNVLLNEFLNRDKRFVGLFINSAYEDMSRLSNFNFEKNAFVFPGENGAGKDREKAKEFVKSQVKSLLDIFTKYPLQDNVIVFFSTDGGTGSGTAIMILQTLRKACPNKKINVIAVLPDTKKNEEVLFENSLNCCSELSEIEGIIDDIKFIDNTKGDNYEEINRKAIDDLNMALNINGTHEIGDIDDSDSKIVNTTKGYGLILRLDDNEKSEEKAVENAIENTVFAVPDSYDCDYLGISVKEDQYDATSLEKLFKVNRVTHKTYTKKFNTLVFGGCTSAPNETIEYLKIRLDEIREQSKKSTNPRKKMITVNTDIKVNKKTSKPTDKATYTEEELDNLVNDLENLFG
jgi:hypothetical protein